jgi:hypothetical protein
MANSSERLKGHVESRSPPPPPLSPADRQAGKLVRAREAPSGFSVATSPSLAQLFSQFGKRV